MKNSIYENNVTWNHGPKQLRDSGFPLAADHLLRHLSQRGGQILPPWWTVLETNSIVARSLVQMTEEKRFEEWDEIMEDEPSPPPISVDQMDDILADIPPLGYPETFPIKSPNVEDLDCELWRKAKAIGVRDAHLLYQFQDKFAQIRE